jgi:hypothetical protein
MEGSGLGEIAISTARLCPALAQPVDAMEVCNALRKRNFPLDRTALTSYLFSNGGTGVPPATLAEFNLNAGGTDFYDV